MTGSLGHPLPLFEDAAPSALSIEDVNALNDVDSWIRHECRRHSKSVAEFFGELIRRAIDEVLDGPPTGRWSISQLEKTEKTHIGTKVEIIVRTSLFISIPQGDLQRFELSD